MFCFYSFFKSFFKILIFQVIWRVRAPKTVQNARKFSPSCPISQEPHHMIVIMAHMCRMIIPPSIFSFFPNFDSRENYGWMGGRAWVKGQKMVQNQKNFCLSHSVSQALYIIVILLHMCKMMTSSAFFFFFHFFKILIFWVFRDLNDLKLPISVCLSLYIRNCR